jgi:hypothetical protein
VHGESLLGPDSEFGFETPFKLFDLPPISSVFPPVKLGISSVSVTLPYPIKKSRYLSSAYWQLSL